MTNFKIRSLFIRKKNPGTIFSSNKERNLSRINNPVTGSNKVIKNNFAIVICKIYTFASWLEISLRWNFCIALFKGNIRFAIFKFSNKSKNEKKNDLRTFCKLLFSRVIVRLLEFMLDLCLLKKETQENSIFAS